MSPTPGRSTLITSAPMKASSCVQVGPDCTWVKSRIRTPSSALPSAPQGFELGDGIAPFDAEDLAEILIPNFCASLVESLRLMEAFFASGFVLTCLIFQ